MSCKEKLLDCCQHIVKNVALVLQICDRWLVLLHKDVSCQRRLTKVTDHFSATAINLTTWEICYLKGIFVKLHCILS